MGAESCEKSESFLATFGPKLWSITLFVHARYGARKVLCTGLMECGGVLVQNSKVQVTPTRGQKIEHAAPLPHAQLGTLHTTQSAQLVPPTSMALNLEVSNKAPALPIELTQDLMDAFEIISNVFGGSALGQASMKAMQCLPLAWACLAIIEAGKKAKDVRDREASRSYQEVALPGFIKLCHEAIEASSSIIHCCSCCCHSNLF